MQKINLITQSVLELFHCENGHNDDNNNTQFYNTDQFFIIRERKYSIADKKRKNVSEVFVIVGAVGQLS